MNYRKLLSKFGIHLHDWRYYQERNSKEQVRLLFALGYPRLARHTFYRECQSCGKIQGLDIDGWCDFMFKKDERKVKRYFKSVTARQTQNELAGIDESFEKFREPRLNELQS